MWMPRCHCDDHHPHLGAAPQVFESVKESPMTEPLRGLLRALCASSAVSKMGGLPMDIHLWAAIRGVALAPGEGVALAPGEGVALAPRDPLLVPKQIRSIW